eukprot:496959_1
MTEYERGAKPETGKFFGFHHCEFWVSNAKQAAAYFCKTLGFKEVAYRGLETGNRETCSHVVQQGNIFYVFTSSYKPDAESEIGKHVSFHGDGVKDVAFIVDDARAIYKKALERGARSAMEPVEEKDDSGSVVRASICTYGDTIHTLIEMNNYPGVFLPGYEPVEFKEEKIDLPECGLEFIDHCVGNQPDGEMVQVAEWYEKVLDFHRFWSVDDKQIHEIFFASFDRHDRLRPHHQDADQRTGGRTAKESDSGVHRLLRRAGSSAYCHAHQGYHQSCLSDEESRPRIPDDPGYLLRQSSRKTERFAREGEGVHRRFAIPTDPGGFRRTRLSSADFHEEHSGPADRVPGGYPAGESRGFRSR